MNHDTPRDFSSERFEPDLLDLHLGRLSHAERADIVRRIESDAALAAQHEALSGVFQALNCLRDTPAAPTSLHERIRSRVAGLPVKLRLPTLPETDEGERVIRLHSFREVLAVAAMIVLAVGVGVPGVLHMRERTQRTACAWNLGQIGRAMNGYAATFSSLPFAGWSSRDSWQPTGEPGVDVLPNRRHNYLLLRTGRAAPSAFLCPSAPGLPMPADAVRSHNDFLESRNVSFASQNMAGVRPTPRSDPATIVLGDDNPLFEDGMPLVDLAARLGLHDPAASNSRVHGGAGQNTLRLGGETVWSNTPNCGVNGDNIWTLDQINRYTGREGPRMATDSHLLK